MNEVELESKIQEKGLNAPRLTPVKIMETINNTCFWQPVDTTLTVCVLILKNGTLVVGQSACVCPENFDKDIGEDLAFEDAKRKVWALEGYLLKQKLFEAIK